MVNKTSNVGPYTIGIDSDLEAGETREFLFREIVAGPRNVRGYLRQFFGQRGGMDYLYVQNGSGNKIYVETATGSVTSVSSATSSNISGPITRCTISSDNLIAADDLDIQVGNVERPDNSSSFSGRQLVADLIPGIGR